MVESTAVSCIHPDKYNNSVDRIISKEEEREDPRRELQSIFAYSGVSTNNTRTTRFLRIQCILQCFSCNPATPRYFYIQNEFFYKNSPRNTTTTRLIPCRLLPATVSRVSKHSTWQNKAPGYLTAFQAHTALAGFQLILPGRIAFQAAASIPATPTVAPRRIPT